MDSSLHVLNKGLKQLGEEYHFSQECLAGLGRYLAELMKWRQRMNLVSKSASEIEVIEKHFIDSLSLLPELDEKSRLLDIGTGAGFPGLVCRVALPELALCLVEPRLKRVRFLQHIVRTLGLKDDGGEITIHSRRMESKSPLCKERFTHVTCRAVAEIGAFVEIVSCFSGSGAELLLMKGPRWKQEFEMAQPILRQYGYRLEKVREIRLPFSGAERFVLNFTETE